jgi:hypothetical protein
MSNAVFVWTARDVAGGVVLCFFALAFVYFFIDNLIDKYFRKRKKYYHKP